MSKDENKIHTYQRIIRCYEKELLNLVFQDKLFEKFVEDTIFE